MDISVNRRKTLWNKEENAGSSIFFFIPQSFPYSHQKTELFDECLNPLKFPMNRLQKYKYKIIVQNIVPGQGLAVLDWRRVAKILTSFSVSVSFPFLIPYH